MCVSSLCYLRILPFICGLYLQMLYLSPDSMRNPLWFTVGKGTDELVPTGMFNFEIQCIPSLGVDSQVDMPGDGDLVYTLWKHPTLLPTLSTPSAVIPILIGGADLMIPGGTPTIHHLPLPTLDPLRM